MEWSEDGIVLATRPLGEGGVILDALTRGQGRHLGLLRGGASRRMAGVLEPGNLCALRWRARLHDQLGSYTAELKIARAAALFSDRLKLTGLASVAATASACLVEREPHPRVHDTLDSLITLMTNGPDSRWLALAARWELLLLEELGFGLDLSECAATGDRENLDYVSPKSAKAVSRAAGAPYREKLLKLPAFLLDASPVESSLAAVCDAFDLTGFFLERHVLTPHNRALPAARARFIAQLAALRAAG
jgi:DNA repair protein RecO (recombination protein O)